VQSIITTIKNPEDIQNLLKDMEIEPREIIILTKGEDIETGKGNYQVRRLEGNFHQTLKDIKDVFDGAEDPIFIAGESELDIYLTYYLTQFSKETPFYVVEDDKLILVPVSSSHGFVSTKRKILEILSKRGDVSFKYIQDNLSRQTPRTKHGRRKFSETTINQYLHELENMDLIDVEVKRNKKYSLNDRGAHYIDLLK